MQIRFVIQGIVLAGLVAGTMYSAQETFNLCASVLSIPLSGPFLSFVDGHEFTFHQIAGDQFEYEQAAASDDILTQFDVDGNLVALHDGKQRPLVLGSMPRKLEYIQRLRFMFNLADTAQVGIYSLNRPYELAWTGAAATVERDAGASLLLHPTTDECAPSMPDILRLVQRLMGRDQSEHELSYVHCLAGRGRSATTVAAYIYCLLKQKDMYPEVAVVERYLQSKRPQVRFSSLQKQFLQEFREKLFVSSFADLCAEHADAMAERDASCAFDVMAPTLRDYAHKYGLFKVCAAFAATIAVGVKLRTLS